jgi:Fe-S-cluster-containing hydrogenase components 2
MLEVTGVPTQEQIDSVFPSIERLEKGPVAVIECYQSIPCNPCSTACKFGGIAHMEDINDLPKTDFDKCNGCTLCVSRCPGLSTMVVDYTYSADQALLKIPYEFRPLPAEGETVMGLDREGNEIMPITVVKVMNSKALDRTPVISIAVPKDQIKVIRHFKLGGQN